MSNSKTKFCSTDLVCMSCGSVNTICRKLRKQKSVGHIKHMYCHICMDITSHYEVVDISKFVWNYCFYSDKNLSDDVKLVLSLLKKREDDYNKGEDGLFKKVLTRREME